tara:strand:+ start:41 stop:406 length:366 start_codon:yes stop_codon:yes gene_type:complete
MDKKRIDLSDSKILIMGYTFKENCPDTRNTKIKDIVEILSTSKINVDIFDPWISERSSIENVNLNFIKDPKKGYYDALIIAVAHNQFISIKPEDFLSFCKTDRVIVDLKHVIPKEYSDIRL